MKKSIYSIATVMTISLVLFTFSCSKDNNTAMPTTSTELTLDNATTSISNDAPAFFKKYFKNVTITTDISNTIISFKSLPPYKTYYYGIGNANYTDFDYSRGVAYKPNPNKIKEQSGKVIIPNSPVSRGLTITSGMITGTVGGNANQYQMGSAGVAINGVYMFNPLAAPGDNIETEAFTFDNYNAHPTGLGQYHYHQYSKGPLEVLAKLGLTTNTEPGYGNIELYGIMCDGTLVLGKTELDGSAPSTSDFDAQQGHVHDIKDNDGTIYFTNRYHVHIAPNWTIPRKFTPEIQYYGTCNAQ